MWFIIGLVVGAVGGWTTCYVWGKPRKALAEAEEKVRKELKERGV